tara:strand:+ start:418 stop:1413 length:996 start_codon:yes stop_codon:yes gene_type:complete
MYTTKTATREKALIAANAANRAMDRHVCCKSQFKFKCFSCGEMIHRGDKITRCKYGKDGMTLRFRGGDMGHGLTLEETAFYQAETGTRRWVHIGCIPCYWDSLPEDSNEYSPPALRPVLTDWESKLGYEYDEWYSSTNHYDMEEFIEIHGYPQEKWMKDRIIHSVTRFQAIWRGYLYKKAYPVALLQSQAEQMYPQQEAVCEEIDSAFAYMNQKWLWSGEGGEDEHVNEPVTIFNIARQWWYGLEIGNHCEVLFNAKQSSEAIYSGEIIEIQYRGDWGKIKVKFHHDGEIRKYTAKKFKILKNEVEDFKAKMGIEAKIIGKLATRCLYPTL